MSIVRIITDPRYPSHPPISERIDMSLRTVVDPKNPTGPSAGKVITEPSNIARSIIIPLVTKNVSRSLKLLRKNWKLASGEITESFNIYSKENFWEDGTYFQLSVNLIRGKICLKVCSRILSSKATMVIKGKSDIVAFDFMSEDLETLVNQYILKCVLKEPLNEEDEGLLKVRPITNSDIVYCNYPRRGRTWHVRMMNSNELIEKFYNRNNYINEIVK